MSRMGEVHVTLLGNVASGPEFAVCGNGAPRAAFRLAVPERRFDRTSELWITSRISHYTVVCWRALAEHVGSSLGRGDPVIVTGRQRIIDGATVEVDATAVGHDLRCGLSSFRTVARHGGSPGAAQTLEADPFAVPIPGTPPSPWSSAGPPTPDRGVMPSENAIPGSGVIPGGGVVPGSRVLPGGGAVPASGVVSGIGIAPAAVS
jgi:single-strand DNA-binding protein